MKNNTFIEKNISIGRLIVTLLMLLLVVVGGTFAWLTYSSRESALVLTIGDINDAQITLTPYQVKGNMLPVTSYTSGVYSDVTIDRGEGNSTTLYYKINQLDSELKSVLQYKIVCGSSYKEVKTGYFSEFSGDYAMIWDESTEINNAKAASSKTTHQNNLMSCTNNGALTNVNYRVYTWVDSSESDQSDIQDSELNIELNGSIGSVTVTGENTLGKTLTAKVTDYSSASNTSYKYQWFWNSTNSTSGGTALTQPSTSNTYTINKADFDSGNTTSGNVLIGKYIYVVVTVTEMNYSGRTYSDITDAANNSTATVKKATCSCGSLSATTMHYPSGVNGTLSYSCVGDGNITVTSGSTGVITVGSVGTTSAALTGKSIGTSRLRVNMAEGNYYYACSNYKDVSVGASTYTVSLDKNDSRATASSPTQVTVTYASSAFSPTSITLPKMSYKISGFGLDASRKSDGATVSSTSTVSAPAKFNGWYTAKSGGSKVINSSATLSYVASVSGYTDANSKWIRSSGTTFYAQWGTGSAKLPTITKTGYTCGWTTSSTGTSIVYASGSTQTFSNDVTLYGVCTANTYTVTYYNGSTKLDTVTYTYDQSYTLKKFADMGGTVNDSTYGWGMFGWTTSTSGMTFEITNVNGTKIDLVDSNTVTISNLTATNGGNIDLYAVYSRKLMFFLECDIESGGSTTPVYNSSYRPTQYRSSKSNNVSSVISDVMVDLDGWNKLGFRDDTTAGAIEYGENTSISPAYNVSYRLYAIYSRTITFMSGVDAVTTDGSRTQYLSVYHNTLSSVTSYTPSTTGLSTYGWSALGYRDDTTAADKEYAKATSITVPYSTSGNVILYAVYSRTITFASGDNKSTVTTTTQYMNTTGNKVSTITTPNAADIAGWEAWYLDNVDTPLPSDVWIDFGITYDGSASNGFYEYNYPNSLQALYLRTATFYSGINKSKSDSNAQVRTSDGKYNLALSDSSPIEYETISGWTFLGWRDDTSAGAQEIAYNANSTSTSDKFYAVYSKDSAVFYSGSNKATTKTQTQYYNTNGEYAVTTLTPAAITGWTASGWRDDTTAGAKEYNSATRYTSTTAFTNFYAIYTRTATFYSGVNKATTNTATQYYNTNNSYSVTTPASPSTTNLSTYGWSALGWRDDTTAGAKETAAGSASTSSVQTFYAVYSRTITFKSGTSAATTDGTRTQYYNSNTAITAVTTYTPSAISGWTAIGYRDDTTADNKEYASATSITPAYNTSNTFRAVYSRNVTFYSGVNLETAVSTVTQYYNTAGNYGVISTDAPTPTSITGWTTKGWRDDTTASTAETALGSKVTSSANKFYAVYERTVTFYSGINKATTATKTQYYNTANNYSTQATPTPSTTGLSTYGWTVSGWRDDTTAGAKETSAGSAATSSASTFYAVYSRTIIFYSGKSKATTASESQYYNSYNTMSNITMPTPAAITGFTALGWRGDTTAANKEFATGYTISTGVEETVTTKAFYAVYSRTATFYSGKNKATTNTATQYYNTNNAYRVQSPTPASRSGWTTVGWVAGTSSNSYNFTSSSKLLSSNSVLTSSAQIFYGVYSRNVTVRSGVDMVSSASATQYYESSNYWIMLSDGLPEAATIAGWEPHSVTLLHYEYDENNQIIGGSAGPGFLGKYGGHGGSSIDCDPYTQFTTYYIRTATFYSGVNKATSVTKTQAYNCYTTYSGSTPQHSCHAFVGSDNIPTPATISGWTALGWRNNMTATTADSNFDNYLAEPANFYAVYSRTLTFKSGSSAATTDGTRTQYYNSANNITSVTTFTPANISGWTKLGYRDDTTAGDKEYASATSVTPAYNTGSTFYAVYSRNATYKSGVNSATSVTQTQYYNSYNKYSSTTPTPATIDGWSALGWRDDTTAGAKETSTGSASSSSAATFYAVYSRNATFYSGVNKATTKTVTQYYNSANNYSVTTPTPSTTNLSTYGWGQLGWRIDTTATTAQVAAGSASTYSNNMYYAVYSRTITFKSGSKAATTDGTRTQYYNTNTAITAITTLNPATISGWTKLGYRDDTTAGDKEYASATSVTPAYNVSNTFYGVYSRNATYYSGVNKATSVTAIQYYNSNNKYSTTTLTPTDISGWTTLGWRDDTTAGAKEITAGSASTSSSATFYAVYSRTATFYSNVPASQVTDTATQYYNSNNVYSVKTPNPSATSLTAAGFSAIGWRDDTTAGDKETASGGTYTGSSNVFYGVHSRTLTFYSGKSKAKTDTAVQYYNSDGHLSNITMPTPSTSGFTSECDLLLTAIGWRHDTGLTPTVDGSIQHTSVKETWAPSANESYTFYAVYSRTATFYSGSSNASTATATQYYNSNGAYSVTTPSTITAISGLTALGWRDDTTAGAKETTAGSASTSSACKFYATYSRTATFKSGINSATSATATQYYNSNGGYRVTTPSNPSTTGLTETASVWTALGWRDDTTAGAKETSAGSASTSSAQTFYAVYSREIIFYDGSNKAVTNRATQYYNSANNFSSITPPAITPISGWTTLGWRDDTAAGSSSYDASTPVSPSQINTKPTYYAVYSRTVTFYSGVNKATTKTSTQYYNTANVYSVSLPSESATAISGWTTLGWRDDTTAGVAETITTSSASVFYAVYSRSVTFYSGVNNATTETKTQYYNSYNKYATEATPTPSTTNLSTYGWSALGWRPDTTATTAATSAGSAATSSSNVFYAVYSRSITFKSGVNNASSTGKTQYYNSANNITSITTPTPSTTNLSTYGWSTLGWRDDTTASTSEVGSNTAITPAYNSSVLTYYGVYSRTLKFVSGVTNAVSDNEAQSTATVTQYYNTTGNYSGITAADGYPMIITGWTEIGYRDDTTAGDKEYAICESPVYNSGTTLYAVYSRNLTFKGFSANATTSGGGVMTYVLTPQTTTKTQYFITYNNGVSSVTVPSLGNTIQTGWAFRGYRTDASRTSATISTTGSVNPAWDDTTTYNAVYSKNYVITFNANGGEGTMSSLNIPAWINAGYGTTASVTSATLTSNSFTNSDYAFGNWNTNSSGTGTSYENASIFGDFNVAYNAEPFGKTLYAIWVNKLYLYNNGSTNTSLTGGFEVSPDSNLNRSCNASQNGQLTMNNNNFVVWTEYLQNEAQAIGFITTANSIDLTNYKKLYIKCSVSLDVLSAEIGAFTDKLYPPHCAQNSAATVTISATTSETLYEIDISLLSGAHYIGFYVGDSNWYSSGSITVSEVYLTN